MSGPHTEVLDAPGVSSVYGVGPGRTLRFSFACDDLAGATLTLKFSFNPRGPWVVARDARGEGIRHRVTAADNTARAGEVINNAKAGTYFRWELVENPPNGTSFGGEVEIAFATANHVFQSVADPTRGQSTVEYGDQYTRFREEVRFDEAVRFAEAPVFSSVNTYEDNAAALAAGEVPGTLVQIDGALTLVAPE